MDDLWLCIDVEGRPLDIKEQVLRYMEEISYISQNEPTEDTKIIVKGVVILECREDEDLSNWINNERGWRFFMTAEDFIEQCSQSEHNLESEVWWVL